MAIGLKDWERLYRDAARLIETMPVFDVPTLQPAEHEWLGRAYAVINEALGIGEGVPFTSAVNRLQAARKASEFETLKGEVRSAIYRAFAVAERNVPAGVVGSFIPVGA